MKKLALLMLALTMLARPALSINKVFRITNAGCTNGAVAAGFTCTFLPGGMNISTLPLFYTAQIELSYSDVVVGGCTGYDIQPQICTTSTCAASAWENVASPTIAAGVATIVPMHIQRNVDVDDFIAYTLGFQGQGIRFVVSPRVACATAETLTIYLTLGAP